MSVEREGLRIIRAANPSALTLDGTRTHIVGRDRVAVIDPGPLLESHLDAVADTIGDGVVVSVLLTHRHPDHDAGAAALAARVNAPVLAIADGNLTDADVVETDAGALRVLATPGHTPDHAAFHWPAARLVFVGDLMLGGMDTALVAPPEGDLREYLASLGRVRALDADALVPAHGPAFDDPAAAIDRYVAHRHARLDRARKALEDVSAGGESLDALMRTVYGADLPPNLAGAARAALVAYLEYLAGSGEARRTGPDRWERSAP